MNPAVTDPSTYIVLLMIPPTLKRLPGLTTTFPWMKLPTEGGSVTVIVVFVIVLKFSSEDIGTGPSSLGRLGHQAEVAADRERRAVGEAQCCRRR